MVGFGERERDNTYINMCVRCIFILLYSVDVSKDSSDG